jgi:hypothetical protein
MPPVKPRTARGSTWSRILELSPRRSASICRQRIETANDHRRQREIASIREKQFHIGWHRAA